MSLESVWQPYRDPHDFGFHARIVKGRVGLLWGKGEKQLGQKGRIEAVAEGKDRVNCPGVSGFLL